MELLDSILREAEKLPNERLEEALAMARGMDAANQIAEKENEKNFLKVAR